MSRTVYYLVESAPWDEGEAAFRHLPRAQAALAERVLDLVADDFAVTERTDSSARLEDAYGDRVSLHIVEADAEALLDNPVVDPLY